VGKKIVKLKIERHGVFDSIRQLAVAVGVNPSTLAMWEAREGAKFRRRDGRYCSRMLERWLLDRDDSIRWPAAPVQPGQGIPNGSADLEQRNWIAVKLRADALTAELKLSLLERSVVPVADLTDGCEEMAGILREAGRKMQRRGEEGQICCQILDEALQRIRDVMQRVVLGDQHVEDDTDDD
jgi:hypothetical protein